MPAPHPLNEQLAFLFRIANSLDELHIPYMLTGSLALAVWSRPRMTRDVDVIVALSTTQLPALLRDLERDSYVSADAARAAVEERAMFNAIELTGLMKADFIVLRDEAYEQEKFARRRRVQADGTPLWVISPEDLVLSKLIWGLTTESARQREDVRDLLRDRPDLDEAYLSRWATTVGVADALREIRR